jgi:predicted Rossmann fold nucleotide-binding protein DprA/Smf involved in DNA uptake
MSILHAIGFVEKHGTVYAKAVAASEEGYPLPEWDEPGPLVRVTLKPHPNARSEGSASRRTRKGDRSGEITALLQVGEMSAAEIAEAIGMTTRQLQRLLKALQTEGRVETNGASRNSPRLRYRLPTGAD